MDELERIKREALALPIEDRKALRSTLTKSINAVDDIPPDVDAAEIVRVAEQITGGDVLGNRARCNVSARVLVADRLRAAGVRYGRIGEALGIQRTTAYHLTATAQMVRESPVVDRDIAKALIQMYEILPL
ncbi:MAG: hypothetical protein IJ654_05395 [Bacteroidales bacterium]|nr:hypothetical protein [Bacteroidales bacterium]